MNRRILIIGGGLTGLTLAFRLVTENTHVLILDKHPKPLHPDAASPIIIHGFESATWKLLEDLGRPSHLQRTYRVSLEFCGPSRKPHRFTAVPLPSPFHAALGILLFNGLPIKDRWALLNVLEKCWEGSIGIPNNLACQTADSWLSFLEQSSQAYREIWDPLCHFFLGGALTDSSSRYFSNILTTYFLSSRRNLSTFVLPSGEHQWFQQSLHASLAGKNVSFRFASPAIDILADDHRVTGVKIQSGELLTADHYVSSISPQALATCLSESLLTKYAYFGNMMNIPTQSSLFVQFPVNLYTPHPRLFLSTKGYQWIIMHAAPSQPSQVTLVSCLMIGDCPWLNHPNSWIIKKVLSDLSAQRLPIPPTASVPPPDCYIIRRLDGIPSPQSSSSTFRPVQQSPLSNLSLAGSWTDTGLPASRESAIMSADLCAQTIIHS